MTNTITETQTHVIINNVKYRKNTKIGLVAKEYFLNRKTISAIYREHPELSFSYLHHLQEYIVTKSHVNIPELMIERETPQTQQVVSQETNSQLSDTTQQQVVVQDTKLVQENMDILNKSDPDFSIRFNLTNDIEQDDLSLHLVISDDLQQFLNMCVVKKMDTVEYTISNEIKKRYKVKSWLYNDLGSYTERDLLFDKQLIDTKTTMVKVTSVVSLEREIQTLEQILKRLITNVYKLSTINTMITCKIQHEKI